MHVRSLDLVAVLAVAVPSSTLTGCLRSRESTVLRATGENVAAVTRSDELLRAAVAEAEARLGRVAVFSQSGVAYIDIAVGDGATPRRSDQIVAHYVGWLLDGTKFESSHERGKPGTFGVSDVVAGCTESLLTMRVGGKRKVFVPAHLAYGSTGRPGLIPPDSPLIYEFDLITIK